MKLSIDTDVDAYESVLAAVNAAYQKIPPPGGGSGHAELDREAEDDDYLPGHWTPRRLRKLAEWLRDSDAAVAVRYIAEHAPAVDLDEVFLYMADHTGIPDFDGRAMGGRMSAVGFARNSIGGGVGPVYETDYNTRKYRMDKRLAAALLAEMDAAATE